MSQATNYPFIRDTLVCECRDVCMARYIVVNKYGSKKGWKFFVTQAQRRILKLSETRALYRHVCMAHMLPITVVAFDRRFNRIHPILVLVNRREGRKMKSSLSFERHWNITYAWEFGFGDYIAQNSELKHGTDNLFRRKWNITWRGKYAGHLKLT